MSKHAQVYRFHDTVAIYIGTDPTVYMTPYKARKLSKALLEAAKDIKARNFLDSKVGTFELDIEES